MRPGIRRSKVRTPQLALSELRDLMPLPSKKPRPAAEKFAHRLRAWFYAKVQSFAGRNLKAGL